MDCAPHRQTEDGVSCTTEYDCTQTAAINDMPIDLSGGFFVHCEVTDSGVWHCECEGNHSYEPLSFDFDSDDPWEACALAGEHCKEAIDPTDL